MRYPTSDGVTCNAKMMPEVRESFRQIGIAFMRKMRQVFPLPPKPDGTSAIYSESSLYNALVAEFLDAPEDEQERRLLRGWSRMLEVYEQDEPGDMRWKKKPPSGGKGGSTGPVQPGQDPMDSSLSNGPSSPPPAPPAPPRRKRG